MLKGKQARFGRKKGHFRQRGGRKWLQVKITVELYSVVWPQA